MPPKATRGDNATPQTVFIRYEPAVNAGRYLLFMSVCFFPFFIPFLIEASLTERLLFLGVTVFFMLTYLLERLFPSHILHQVSIFPMTFGGPIIFFGLNLSLMTTGRTTPQLELLAVSTALSILIVNAIIIRRMTSEDSVDAAVKLGMLTMNKHGIGVTPPWTTSLFVTFIQWEVYLINGIRALMIVVWIGGIISQGPYMYSTVGIQDRWPMAFGFMGFPIAFFFSRFWQIPFLWHCQASPGPLIQKARRNSARATREAKLEAEQEAKDARRKRTRSERS